MMLATLILNVQSFNQLYQLHLEVNECVKNPRICSSDKECLNLPGSYRCVAKCSRGYKRVGSGCQGKQAAF